MDSLLRRDPIALEDEMLVESRNCWVLKLDTRTGQNGVKGSEEPPLP